jgi:predicted enzyme related to lactoylglutathione lyase
MSVVDRISAVLPVKDILAAETWYEQFFGRAADAVPMPSLREWHEGSGGIAVLEMRDRAGMGFATMHVDSIDAHRVLLSGRGLTLGPRQGGDAAGVAQIEDPAGNVITIAQRRPGLEATGGGNAGVLRSLMGAFRDRRREVAEKLIAADYTFTSQYDDHIDRKAFFERCWPQGDHFAEMQIERITPDSEGAFVTYITTTKSGEQFRNTEYATISNGQVHSTDVYFGASYRDGKQLVKEPESAAR